MKKWLMMLSVASVMLIVGACGDDTAEEDASTEDTTDTAAEEGAHDMEEMPEPDLENVPDVVAEVNGEELSKEEFEMVYSGQFQQAAMMQQMSGEGEAVDQDELKQQIADGLVSEMLLVQEAENRDYEASEEEVDEIINQLVEANGLESEDEFFAAMEESGMSEDELREELENQVKVQQLISEEAGDTEPTEEEMQEIYDEQIAAREGEGAEDEEAPEFEDVRPQIEEQLVREREVEAAGNIADDLREEADVTIHL